MQPTFQSPAVRRFVSDLISTFGPDVTNLLAAREARRLDRRGLLAALEDIPTPLGVADSSWRCTPPPVDLHDRRVEITGPGRDRKMIDRALASGAQGYMIDGEDSLAPSWAGVTATWEALARLAQGDPSPHRPVLHYRPRGLHLVEANWEPGRRVPAALVDAGVFLATAARGLLSQGSGPYLYLAKLEVEAEGRFWHRVATWAEERLGLPIGSIRFTVLVETLPALLRLEPLVYSLRTRLTGLNTGRWDYIFSCIKLLSSGPGYVLPDRRELTMGQPPLAEAARWVVNVAHRRGCHAIGGMAAEVPSRKDPAAAGAAVAAVCADKSREAAAGCDGTWVAHPDLVVPAREAFDLVLQGRSEQRWRVPGEPVLNVGLVTSPVAGSVTTEGVAEAARSALVYLDAWLGGNGCVAMAGKMEDAATAEISRALLWSWAAGPIGVDAVCRMLRGEAEALAAAGTEPQLETIELLEASIRSDVLPEFITTEGYDILLARTAPRSPG